MSELRPPPLLSPQEAESSNIASQLLSPSVDSEEASNSSPRLESSSSALQETSMAHQRTESFAHQRTERAETTSTQRASAPHESGSRPSSAANAASAPHVSGSGSLSDAAVDEKESEEEVEDPQRVALRTDTDVVPPTDEENADDEHIARLRRIKRMRMEDTALMASTPGAGSSSDAAPKPKARPRPLHVLPHIVYFCTACNEIVRALGLEEGAIAIRRCRFCYYPLCQTCWRRSGAQFHCPRCMREASDSDVDALRQVEDNPDFDIYDVVEDDFRYNNTGRSVFRGKGKGQGKDKGEGEDDPKGKGKGKE
jgi:hypothetical protein